MTDLNFAKERDRLNSNKCPVTVVWATVNVFLVQAFKKAVVVVHCCHQVLVLED